MGVPIAMIVIVAFGVSSDLPTAFGASLSISFLIAGIGLVAIALAQRRFHRIGLPAVASSAH